MNSEKDSNKRLCDAAAAVQAVLRKGYHLAVWSNRYGQKSLYLVRDGDNPWNGAYVCPFKDGQ